MPFKVTLGGKTYSTDSFTLDEADRLEEECGRTWLELNPVRSSKEFRAVARVFLDRDHAPGEVDRIVAAITIGDAMEAVEWVDKDLPRLFEDGMPDPKAEGGHSTITSSSSPDPHGDGPPTSSADNGSVISSSSSTPANRKP